MDRKVIAIDLGASSGRVMLGIYENKRIKLEELHRFWNGPVQECDRLVWDFSKLLEEIKKGLKKAAAYGPIHSLSVDTWGVDFGLLDENGILIENPVHYRDKRTHGMVEKVLEQIPEKQLYEITGTQIMEINTLFQLYSLNQQRPEVLERAKKLLMMPDLFHYALCGSICGDYSMASTTQLWDVQNHSWSKEIIKKLGFSPNIFPPLVKPGSKIGVLSEELQRELGLDAVPVIASAGHDTECAMVAVPTENEEFAFVSCGTWALFGTERLEPCVSSLARNAGMTNEANVEGKTALLKNITGTWLVQECKNYWKENGEDFSFSKLEQLALEAEGGFCILNPNDPLFSSPGDMPIRIQQYAQAAGQRVPITKGELIRCIYESLADMYSKALRELEQCTGKKYSAIHMVGGGSKSSLLCQLTADACRRKVFSGPAEATALGNIGIQLMALGAISNLTELRYDIAQESNIIIYEPRNLEKGDQE